MSLRYRTALATVFSVAVLMAMLLLGYRLIVGEAYADLQRDEAREELARSKRVLDAELRNLDVLLVDWASWDDMYAFAETRSPAFVVSNLPPDILAMTHLNALVIRDSSGAVIVGHGEDASGRETTFEGVSDRITVSSPLLQFGSAGHVSGIVGSGPGPMLVASRPILRSDGSGTPRGSVTMARLLDEQYMAGMNDTLGLDIRVLPLGSAVPSDITAALASGADGGIATGPGAEGRIAAYCYLQGLGGSPVAVLRTEIPRSIEAQSGRTVLAILATTGLTGLGLMLILVSAIDVTVVRRLRRLLEEMNNITGRGSSEGLRTDVRGRDEIGDVAAGVNAMLDRLEAAAADRLRLEQAVTEQERLAEEAFRALDEGLIVVDGAGRCTAANPAALRLLNLRREDVVGQSLDAVLPVLRPADDATRFAGSEFFEVGRRIVAVSRSGGEDGGRTVIALRDVTDARDMERMKRDLIATVSHELRTPLTAIQATVSMLAEGDGGELSDLQRRLVSLLERNGTRLRTLVDDLLDMGALEGGRVALHPERVDLAALCRAVVEEIRPSAAACDVTLREPVGAGEAHVDPRRIHQVLLNLLQNAVKFTPPHGTVDVTLDADDRQVTIAVRDTGIGIGSEDLERVFEKFYRTTEGARFTAGTGLGLAIARSIVALHGGTLRADSDGQSGTTMTITLPVREPATAARGGGDA